MVSMSLSVVITLIIEIIFFEIDYVFRMFYADTLALSVIMLIIFFILENKVKDSLFKRFLKSIFCFNVFFSLLFFIVDLMIIYI